MSLIVLEGIDASGKKTQAELLVKRLRQRGKKAVLIDFPSYNTIFGKLITKYLKGEFGQREKVSRQFASLLYALDRYSRKKEIEDYLRKGFIVVLDRYTQANLAYQTVGLKENQRRKLIKWIEDVEEGLPQADVIVFLDVPPGQSSNLLGKRKSKIKGVRKDIHEKDFGFITKVYMNYKRFASERKWIVVKCVQKGGMKSKEEILNLVFNSLRKRRLVE